MPRSETPWEPDDGDQPYAIVFTPTTSADGDYAGLTPGNIPVTNIDD